MPANAGILPWTRSGAGNPYAGVRNGIYSRTRNGRTSCSILRWYMNSRPLSPWLNHFSDRSPGGFLSSSRRSAFWPSLSGSCPWRLRSSPVIRSSENSWVGLSYANSGRGDRTSGGQPRLPAAPARSKEARRMSLLEVLLLAVRMAVDAFAVSLAAGAMPGPHGPRQAFRLAFHFGLFQFIMPIIGWLAGTGMEMLIRDVDHWVAFGLLAYVGGRMIYSAWQPLRSTAVDPSRGWTLVMLSIAVSIDAL